MGNRYSISQSDISATFKAAGFEGATVAVETSTKGGKNSKGIKVSFALAGGENGTMHFKGPFPDETHVRVRLVKDAVKKARRHTKN